MRGILKSIADKFGATVKETAAKVINEGSSLVSNNVAKRAEVAYKNGKSATIESARTASKDASSSLDRLYKQGKDVTLSQVASATTRASGVVRDTSSNLASRARIASKEASHIVRDASVSMAANAKEAAKEAAIEAKNEAKRGFRWLLIWSLAAVGVYGVATTVSKELVRHALVGTKREERMIENKHSEQSGEGGASANSGRWPWLSSTEHETEQSRERDASTNVGRWLSWGGKSS